jgi:hypothetical protein
MGQLGNAMLDLNARVHFQKEEVLFLFQKGLFWQASKRTKRRVCGERG